MPGQRVFAVTELRRDGQGGTTDSSVRFEWDARTQSSPQNAWEYGVRLRTVREDYPGGDVPTEQVLGPNYAPFTLRGKWDDRYAGAGFAERTRIAFERLVQRGNLVRVEFEGIQIVGLITNLLITYRRKYDVGYSFDFSAHYRVAGGDARAQAESAPRASASPDTFYSAAAASIVRAVVTYASAALQDPSSLLSAAYGYLSPMIAAGDDVAAYFSGANPYIALGKNLSNLNLNAVSGASASSSAASTAAVIAGAKTDPYPSATSQQLTPLIGGTLYATVGQTMADWTTRAAAMKRVLVGRVFSAGNDAQNSVGRLAQGFTGLANSAIAFLPTLEGTRTDLSLAYESGIGNLDFECWARGLASQARMLIVAATAASTELSRRVDRNALALYRPQAGESLYAISNRFFGTPHQWREIAARNQLFAFTLTGAELLIIPDLR